MSKRSLRIVNGQVPPQYQEVLYWYLAQSRKQVWLINLLALPVLVVSGLFFFGVAAMFNRLEKALVMDWPWLVGLLVGLVLTLGAHELVHGLALRMFGARPKFGIVWEGLMLSASAPGYAFSRNQYILVALAPLLGLSFLAWLGLALPLDSGAATLLAIFATLNAAGAVGDMWVVAVVGRYPPQACVVDEAEGVRVLMPGDKKRKGAPAQPPAQPG